MSISVRFIMWCCVLETFLKLWYDRRSLRTLLHHNRLIMMRYINQSMTNACTEVSNLVR